MFATSDFKRIQVPISATEDVYFFVHVMELVACIKDQVKHCKLHKQAQGSPLPA